MDPAAVPPLVPGEHGITQARLSALGITGLMERGLADGAFAFAQAGAPLPGAPIPVSPLPGVSMQRLAPASSDHGVFVLFRRLPRLVSRGSRLGFMAYPGPGGETLAVHTGVYDVSVASSGDGLFDVLLTRTSPPVQPWEASDVPPPGQLPPPQQQNPSRKRILPSASGPNRRPSVAADDRPFPRWVPGDDKLTSYRSFLLIVGDLRPPSENSEAAWRPVVGRDSVDLLSKALASIPPASRLFVDRLPFGETGPIKAKVLDSGHLAEMRLYLEGFECEMRGDSLVIRFETRPVEGSLAYSSIAGGAVSSDAAADAAGDADGDASGADSEDGSVSAGDDISVSCCDDNSDCDVGDDDDTGVVEVGEAESETVWCTGTIAYRCPEKRVSVEDVWGSPLTESLRTQTEKIVVGILGAKTKSEIYSLYEPSDFDSEKCTSPAAFVVRAHVSRDAQLFWGKPF